MPIAYYLHRTVDKRIIIIGSVITVVAMSFWAGSRVPALNEKAAMGGEVSMNALGFDTIVEVQDSDPLPKKIAYTTVNWVETNKKGMTFGVLFASCLMTLFALLRRRSVKGAFANSMLGLFIGAPLGVCVNCSAPIAQGLSARGARLETTLAVMMSSPTMNFIVLTMLFSLFPLYLIGIKILCTLAFILIGIPLLTHFVLTRERDLSENNELPAALTKSCPVTTAHAQKEDSDAVHWLPATQWVLKELAKNLWYLCRTTVPLMLLAGFLGATIITLLPWNTLIELLPKEGVLPVLGSMFLVAAVGVFLPVPISFDVIIASILLSAGLPAHYVMVFLFTLGIYSIYSFMIVWQAISKKAAITLFLSVALLGVFAGGLGYVFHDQALADNSEKIDQILAAATETTEKPLRLPQVLPTNEDVLLLVSLEKEVLEQQTDIFTGTGTISVAKKALSERSQKSETPFTKYGGELFGLDEPYRFSFMRRQFPFEQGHGRTVASGDVHNDGWTDILFSSEVGLSLYANSGGKFFRQRIALSLDENEVVTNAALVDMNNDGWLDIFYTTLGDGAHIIYNYEGYFTRQEGLPIWEDDTSVMISAMGFGDLDGNGTMDVVLGKWDLSRESPTKTAEGSRVVVLFQEEASFRSMELPDSFAAAPTSILVADYNQDGQQDIIVGNDLRTSDFFYLGTEDGAFTKITSMDEYIEQTTYSTMSVAIGDINNDLQQELLFSNTARYSDKERDHISYQEICHFIEDAEKRERCSEEAEMHLLYSQALSKQDVSICLKIQDTNYQVLCTIFYEMHFRQCDTVPRSWKSYWYICDAQNKKATPEHLEKRETAIPQSGKTNVLLVRTDDGTFKDWADSLGVKKSGWTWNMQFADLDNDEWIDVYAANGGYASVKRRESNYFFHNQMGETLSNKTEEFGLTSHRVTNSYTYIDIDNDGDLDIVTIPISAPIEVFKNNGNEHSSIFFELRDLRGNTFGIGSTIIIHYGEYEEKHQLRVVLASGGKASFNEPVAHFGLGKYNNISRIEILWSTGERSELTGNFVSGNRYRITRTH